MANLTLMELFPIMVATEMGGGGKGWGVYLRNKIIFFQCDKFGVVQAINAQMTSSPTVVKLLRHLVLKVLELNAHSVAVQVPGVQN